MSISLSDFKSLMKKASMPATGQPDSPGNQAMAAAAKMATPPGGIPLPVTPKQEEQPTEEQVQQNAVQDAMRYRAELEKKDKELATARRQIQQAENSAQHARDLAEVQKREADALLKIKDREAQADANIRKNEAASLQRLQKSEGPQVDYAAKEEAHKARLERDSALEKAKRALEQSAERDALTKEKAKAYVDIADQSAKEYVGTVNKVQHTIDASERDKAKHEAEMESIAQTPLAQKVAAQQMPSTGAQQPQRAGAQQIPSTNISAEEQYKKNQQYANRQRTQQQNLAEQGQWTASVTNASDDSLYGRAVAIATAKNQLHKLQREGKTGEATALKQSIAGLQRDFDTYKQSIESAAKGGDQEAQNQLNRYQDAAYRRGTVSGNLDASAEHGIITRGIRSLFGKKNLTDFAGQSELENIATQDEQDQIRKDVGVFKWMDPTKLGGDVVNFIGGGVAKSVEDNAQSQDMARRRGVSRDWFGEGTGQSADVLDYQRAAKARGLKTSVMGNAANIGTEAALAAASFVPVGGAAALAGKGAFAAGRAGMQQGLRAGLRAGWRAASPNIMTKGTAAQLGIGAAGTGAQMALGTSAPLQAEYLSPSGEVYRNGTYLGSYDMQGSGMVPPPMYAPYMTSKYSPVPAGSSATRSDTGRPIWKSASVANVPSVSTPVVTPSRPQDPIRFSNRFGTNAIDYTSSVARMPGLLGTVLDVADPLAQSLFGFKLLPSTQPKLNQARRVNPMDVAVKTNNYMRDENPVKQNIQANWLSHYGYPTN